MRPFILTELQAGKLPRWGLLLLCVLYALPGFVGRDPWRSDDATGFGIALTMARGDLADWLMPNVAGAPIPAEGPLPFWLAALPARLLAAWVPEHATVRAVAIVGLWLTFAALWYATWALARRPGVQPSDPFGASASRVDFGRAIADSALLVLLATLGLVARLHETTAEVAQLAWVALFLYGASLALERGRRGGLIAGAAIGASVLTRGLPTGAALLVALIVLSLARPEWRWNARHSVPAALAVALAGALAWPAWLAAGAAESQAYLTQWWQWNRAQLDVPTMQTVPYLLRTMPWFLWPAWPVAGWALIRWRSRLGEPSIALPALTFLALLVVAVLAPQTSESPLIPLAAPLAVLAAFGLPTLRRGVVSLIDWFSVMSFTVFGVAVWGYWFAFVTGVPQRMAYRAERLAPGFEIGNPLDELLLGIMASLAWLALVRWRISRQPPMIWRAMVLSSGGLVLAWVLLMTLWLPVFNERNTYRDLSLEVAAALPAGHGCVQARHLGLPERASLAYFGRLDFDDRDGVCRWLLVQDDGPLARTDPPGEDGWTYAWSGRRRGNADERFRLYRRAS